MKQASVTSNLGPLARSKGNSHRVDDGRVFISQTKGVRLNPAPVLSPESHHCRLVFFRLGGASCLVFLEGCLHILRQSRQKPRNRLVTQFRALASTRRRRPPGWRRKMNSEPKVPPHEWPRMLKRLVTLKNARMFLSSAMKRSIV